MARPQEFETSEALCSAMHVFWSKGYEATSLADILAATGLSKSSLYATFGDKHELFLASFKAYQQQRLYHLERILNNDQPARQSIETFFRLVLDRSTGDALHGSGCMTANEAVELAPHDPDVQRMVAEDFQAIDYAFALTIARGQVDGSMVKAKTQYDTYYVLEEVTVSDFNNWNQAIIEEFRANSGKVGGNFAGNTLLILHTVGAKSGKEHVNPVVYVKDGDRLVIIASKAGAPTNPDWYYNIRAHPLVTVEVGTEQFQAQAEIVSEPERTRLYNKMVEVAPGFAEYQKKTTRVIPVIALTRVR